MIKPGDKVKYAGGLFPELEGKTFTVILVKQTYSVFGEIVEVFDDETGRIFQKYWFDFEVVEKVENKA
jgi:hypothetical protein